MLLPKKTVKIPRAAKNLGNTAEHAPASSSAVKSLAKSTDPEFMKFTTYIKKSTHRAVKMRMVGAEREMSDLVENLLSDWLKEDDFSRQKS